MLTTPGREAWAKQARHAFFAQTYENARIVECAEALKIGTKRNYAIREADGAEIICHWDDDDIYHPERIAQQVKLLQDHPEVDIVGYHSMEFWNVETGARHLYVGREGYAIGVSLCYRRRAWEDRNFEPINEGEDNQFQIGRRVLTIPANNMIVARIHNGNTSAKHPDRNPLQWVAA
jgi:glycosyltransferase involved in cell wall biosynthesis